AADAGALRLHIDGAFPGATADSAAFNAPLWPVGSAVRDLGALGSDLFFVAAETGVEVAALNGQASLARVASLPAVSGAPAAELAGLGDGAFLTRHADGAFSWFTVSALVQDELADARLALVGEAL